MGGGTGFGFGCGGGRIAGRRVERNRVEDGEEEEEEEIVVEGAGGIVLAGLGFLTQQASLKNVLALHRADPRDDDRR